MLYFRSRSTVAAFLAVLLFVFGFASHVLAVTRTDFAALQVQTPGKITMKPGEEKTVSLTFQNIGKIGWTNDGKELVSIYTYGPKYRTSAFQASSWLSASQPTKISESSVVIGKTGTIKLTLKAPISTGTYTETFHLAAENVAWISGGEFALSITVADTAISNSSKTSSLKSSKYQAEIVSTKTTKFKAKGGVTLLYPVTLNNVGTSSWGKRSIEPTEIRFATGSGVSVKHKSWKSSSVVAYATNEVKPGESETIMIAMTSPSKKGTYTASFRMAIDGTAIAGSEISIPIEVTKDAPDAVASENIKKILISEPTIRVGVMIVDEETDDRVEIVGASAIELRDVQGNLLANVASGEIMKAFYEDGYYFYDVGRGLEKSSYGLRFITIEANAVLTVTNFDRRETRNAGYADNQFRNVLELRYNTTKDRTWLINELPMEYYLRGLAETSDSSHDEFKKALFVAARTYAYYHWQRATKHDAEFFHVDAYADQVYNGYGYEARTPNITKAVEATRGITATYDGATAITAYFSRSDGRTRDWSEVWGGSVPWSKSVAVPCDEGKTLWGHGVGMSASGGLCMAKEGKTYDEIVKYFYTGVALEKRWE
ncbi:MAG: NBR1-Ig-like domain-containing protein [Patescibacteria group bacterium]